MAREKRRQSSRIWKNPNIRQSEIYLTSLWLLKTRKCSTVVLQIKKSNDQTQIKYKNCKKSAYNEKV